MKLIKLGGVTLNQIPLHWEHNLKNILDAIAIGRSKKVSILCLPELCITGYGCEDAFYAPGVHATALKMLERIVPETENMVVSVGLPMMYQNHIFNTVCLIANKDILGFVAKQYLPGDGIHYEPRWFTPWPENNVSKIKIGEKTYPFGDIFFKLGDIKIGFEVCEDAWVSSRPGVKLHKYGIDIILNPSASHFAFDKLKVRKRFVLEGSRAFGCAYVYANMSGNEAGRAIYDAGTLIASVGELKAVGERLIFDDVRLTAAVIDIEDNRVKQAQSSVQFKFADLTDICVESSFSFPEILPEESENEDKPWEASSHIKEEEFTRAVSLGLFDYMRKSYSKGFVISLSGGADSAAIASICSMMIRFGIESIGLEKYKAKLGYFKEIQDCQTAEEIAARMITTAYQPTENSGSITRNAASGLAKAINATHLELDVNKIFKGYTNIISEKLGRQLSWETDDIALQNIQARVRAPSVWMLANINGALLLSTSNRSEAAVGYATMDGDTSGGLSPIAGIDKAFLRSWLRWLENEGIQGEIKIPALKAINEQQPTAELRPAESKQTDEDDLMPYDLLDAIEEAAIRDKKMPLESFQLLLNQFPQYNRLQLKDWVIRFYRLWCRNQWKRERYAPSFHLDDKNLDPKTWCRFPILSGGFDYEIKELEAYFSKLN
ncbi:NAD(+) synthase [Chondrinema litorale]|uniref:NAD(+) synthase n=1 Tax=Chondrinema litorale TaxID=2994555 RepID=UPI0025427892|nr:NAD(+) synthase [Chondrinema litorale]UZR92551.1 NAD(+) synthase [Chondrinema litorale]